ncbi:MAG TPA: hypothetical protein VGD65_12205 [Chryseosolibacter sp.]
MDSKKIEALLEKYWNCETSLEEEQQLKAYFRGRQIPEQLKETAVLFHYFDDHKKKDLTDSGFDSEVLAKVKSPKQGKVMKLVYNSMRIAAGIAVLVVAVMLVRNEIKKQTPAPVAVEEDTITDPKLAFEETKKALLMISKSFGSAQNQAKKINMFNEAQKSIQKEQEDKPKL